MEQQVDTFNEKIDFYKGKYKNEFPFIFNLLNFVFFVKSIGQLQNEQINRLEYYFNTLIAKFKEKNLLFPYLNKQNAQIYTNIISILNNNKQIEYPQFEYPMSALLLLFNLFETILRLYSKKLFFCKNVEVKINNIIKDNILQLVSVLLNNKREFIEIEEFVDLINSVVETRFIKSLQQRQENRKYNNYYNEFVNITPFVQMDSYTKIMNNFTLFINGQIKEQDYRWKLFSKINILL